MSSAVQSQIASTSGRRSNYRYPIRIDLEYRLLKGSRVLKAGRGRTVNFSSSGILFESEESLPPAMRIHLSIAWPARLNNRVALNLHVELARSGAQRATLQARSEGSDPAVPCQLQRHVWSVHLDQGSPTTTADHRNDEAVSGDSPSQNASQTVPRAAAGFYKELMGRCTSVMSDKFIA